jgi:hypothetical protein
MKASSSCANFPTATKAPSTETHPRYFSVTQPTQLELDTRGDLAGTHNDAELIRRVVADALRECGKSRAQVADEMSVLAGRKVSERMLNGYAAESREDCLFPSELERAFCTATGSDQLLRCNAERHGLWVIDKSDAELVELGRAFLQRTQAEEEIAALQKRLQGRLR